MDGRKIITAGLIPVLAVMCGMPGLCAQLSPAGSGMDSSADMLCGASHMESSLPQPRAVTLRDKVMQVRETYGVKFVYDSTIDLDLPYTGGPAGEGEGLEEALDRIFGGSGIEWRRRRGHIVLVHGEPRELRDSIGTAGPENQAVERRDTISRAARHHYGVKDLHGPLQTGGEQDPDWSRAHRRQKVQQRLRLPQQP